MDTVLYIWAMCTYSVGRQRSIFRNLTLGQHKQRIHPHPHCICWGLEDKNKAGGGVVLKFGILLVVRAGLFARACIDVMPSLLVCSHPPQFIFQAHSEDRGEVSTNKSKSGLQLTHNP